MAVETSTSNGKNYMSHIEEGKTVSESRVILSMMMGPEHANILGNVHGGIIMKMADEAGALAAMRHARHPVVTVAVDSITFVEPVLIGHVLTLNAELTYAGRTSLEARVEVTAEDPLTGHATHTNLAYLVYVAISTEDRQPVAVPPLIAETEAEKQHMALAKERQTERKKRRAQERTLKGQNE